MQRAGMLCTAREQIQTLMCLAKGQQNSMSGNKPFRPDWQEQPKRSKDCGLNITACWPSPERPNSPVIHHTRQAHAKA